MCHSSSNATVQQHHCADECLALNWKKINNWYQVLSFVSLHYMWLCYCTVQYTQACSTTDGVSLQQLRGKPGNTVREHACCSFLNNYTTIMFANRDKSLDRLVTSPGQRGTMRNNVTVIGFKWVPQAITRMLRCLGANHLSIPATTPLYK